MEFRLHGFGLQASSCRMWACNDLTRTLPPYEGLIVGKTVGSQKQVTVSVMSSKFLEPDRKETAT